MCVSLVRMCVPEWLPGCQGDPLPYCNVFKCVSTGVWASRLIPKGKRFGPFMGERKKRSQVTSNVYMWEVSDTARPAAWCVQLTNHLSEDPGCFILPVFRGFLFQQLNANALYLKKKEKDFFFFFSKLFILIQLKGMSDEKCASSFQDHLLWIRE